MSGVGGRTIAEAKERMSQSEAIQWSAYIKRRGSLNIGRRFEISTGFVLEAIYRGMGNKDVDFRKFMPHEHFEDASQPVATFDQVFNLLAGTAA